MTNATLPTTQQAVQLVGPGELKLNPAKKVPTPGPHEILAKVEAVGLCFSDLKLLKQFDTHARKSEVVAGLSPETLAQVQSYVPGKKPTVPGHEVVCRIVAVGSQVKHHKVGERCLVQTDYRDLPTANSASAFGYNFEGALQEYIVMDERVVVDSKGQRYLIPVSEEKSSSAVALVEPWACVEDSYVTRERQTIKPMGRLLVVATPGASFDGLPRAYSPSAPPAQVTVIAPDAAATQPDEGFDDIVYFGADKSVIEILNDKLASRGIINIVLGGQKIGAPVNVGVGRVHYGLTRWVGTTGNDPAQSYQNIPATGEVRAGDRILVVGAGGPMGQMHVLRNVSLGLANLHLVGTDMDDPRLASLLHKAQPLADKFGVKLELVNTKTSKLTGRFSYIALMAPVAPLVAQAVVDVSDNAIINIFAGIPAPVKQVMDLDAYISKKCFMFGTSGSTIADMMIVLDKVEKGSLDTNASLDAVSGIAGAIDGIAAVENRTLAGKIMVYPMLRELPLTPLTELAKKFPTVAAKLDRGQWTKAAEEELLKVAR